MRSFPASSSSTTQPLTKAVAGSFNQTYLLPEKSFSPSMPLTVGIGFCISSDFMNVGANVPVAGELPRYELDRFLTEFVLPGPCCMFPIGEKELLRAWPNPTGDGTGDDRIAETGRALLSPALGDADGEGLPKGLLRHFVGPF